MKTLLKCVFLGAFLVGCSEGSFTSTSQSTPGKDEDKKKSQTRTSKSTDTLREVAGDLEDDPNVSAGVDLGPSRDGEDLDVGSITDLAEAAQNNGIVTVNECLTQKAKNYNIALIFDNSGSQLLTDPSAVRRSGAMIFIDQFADFVRQQPQSVVNFGVFSFNSVSVQVTPDWVRLNDSNVAAIKNHITIATSNPAGATAYTPSLKQAAALFGKLVKQTAKTKNYVVFLTDGYPNAEALSFGQSMESVISSAVDTLVQSYDVAVIAIAAGQGIDANGEKVTRDYLAKPIVDAHNDPNIPDDKEEKHLGLYQRAATPEQLNSVWSNLLAAIGNCNN